MRERAERLLHRPAQLLGRRLLATPAGRRASERSERVELELADAVEVQRQRLGGLTQRQRLNAPKPPAHHTT